MTNLPFNFWKHTLKRLFILFVLLGGSSALAQSLNPKLVWIRAEGGERNEYVYFRREFTLNETPKKSDLHLYADSRYALYVNGNYIGFGPIRSFHTNPEYDTYNLLPYLKPGKNVIGVKALSNGMLTYQLFDYKGGFTAWGNIELKDGEIDLSVDTDWLCKKSIGYDQTAPRFSFATGAIENWDSRQEWDWNLPQTTIKGWTAPVPLKDQEIWGDFTPRPIPKLTNAPIVPLRLMAAYPLADDEDIHSFRISTPDSDMKEYNTSNPAIAYTYIHSPIAQNVSVGLWWGDHYLNGQLIRKDSIQDKESYRRQYTLNLKKGWNAYVVRYGIIWGSWDYYMAVPKSAGLSLSSSQEKGSKDLFNTYGPFYDEKVKREIEQIDATLTVPRLLQNTVVEKWQTQQRENDANQPARDLAWKALDTTQRFTPKTTIEGNSVIPVSKNGTALFYEMSETQLGRIFVEGDFPTGTQIDIGFSEELDQNGFPWLYKRFQVGAGLRFITSEGQKRYESFKPYGLKYMHINISGHDRPVTLTKAGVVRQVYPFEKIGHFECSDPIFNNIWDAGWRTLQLCAEDTYTDTPFRERGLYAGDMLPQTAITMAASGDLSLVAYSLKVFQDMYRDEMMTGKENRHNDFPLLTQVTLDYYCTYTNDWRLAQKYYANYTSLLRNHIRKKDKNGLIPASRVFLEWTDINRENAAMTAYQALLAHAMQITAKWAERFGFTEDKDYFEKEADQLKKDINRVLWDSGKRVYRDGLKSDVLLTESHLTSNIWPLLYGIADSAQAQSILALLKQELMDIGDISRKRKITPYSSFYLFALLYRNGMADLAEYFMKKHWGPMALHSAKPTVWENFDISGNQGTSSHAWSGHPTYFLSTEVLGVNLGFQAPFDPNHIEIMPQSATLEWAEGTVAHPMGPVYVKWKVEGDLLRLGYKAPKGALVKVVPRGRLGKLKLITTKLD
ncbi:trehalase family glycosidase [Ulvibacterium sp.]|uniref:alpha-L-rhamnosidase-related protein n=1 Tax=Ulvibacterium sp. TaxID=2665914 RepID=UPI00260A6C24|nr:trehalase family glycosidase [Ulvibacterium sp.]